MAYSEKQFDIWSSKCVRSCNARLNAIHLISRSIRKNVYHILLVPTYDNVAIYSNRRASVL